MQVVFFDASVLFKAAVTRFLLGAERAGEFTAAWSETVVTEARRNLLNSGRASALAAFEQNIRWPREVIRANPDPTLEIGLNRTDPKDRHVLSAAAAIGASVLVTSNTKDFDRAESAALGVHIDTPDGLGVMLARRNPAALVRYVDRVPPARYERYLELLELELPHTMRLLEPLLGD